MKSYIVDAQSLSAPDRSAVSMDLHLHFLTADILNSQGLTDGYLVQTESNDTLTDLAIAVPLISRCRVKDVSGWLLSPQTLPTILETLHHNQ